MAKSKSGLDRLVEANRRGKKANARSNTKPTVRTRTGARRVLPPEQRVITTATAQIEEIEELELTPDFEPESWPEPDPEDYADQEHQVSAETLVSTEISVEENPQGLVDPILRQVQQEALNRGLEQLRRAPIQTRTSIPEYDTSLPGIVSLAMSADLRSQYAAAKQVANQPLREYLVERLTRCADHTASKPLYINDSIRQAIERIANRNFDTGEELLDWMVGTTGLTLGKHQLRTDPDLIARALDRKDPDQTDGECLSEYLTYGIEVKTGMR